MMPNGQISFEYVEIKDGNKYYSNSKHVFDIDFFEYDQQKNLIKFRKTGLKNDKRKLMNILTLKDNRLYEGIENDNVKIKYERID